MPTQTCGHLYAGTASRARCVGGQDHCGQLYGRGPNGRRGLTHDVLVSERRLRHQGAVPPRAATCRPFGGASQRAPVLPTTSCGRAAAYRATGLRAAGRKRWCRRGARTARPAAGRRGREARQRGGEIVGQPARGLPAVSRPAPPARREPAARPGRPATLPPSCRRHHTGCGPAGPPRCRTCARGSHTREGDVDSMHAGAKDCGNRASWCLVWFAPPSYQEASAVMRRPSRDCDVAQ